LLPACFGLPKLAVFAVALFNLRLRLRLCCFVFVRKRLFVFVFAPWEGVGDKQGEEVEEGEGGVGDKQGEEGVGISSRAAHGKALSSPTSGNICSPSSTFTTPSFAQF